MTLNVVRIDGVETSCRFGAYVSFICSVSEAGIREIDLVIATLYTLETLSYHVHMTPLQYANTTPHHYSVSSVPPYCHISITFIALQPAPDTSRQPHYVSLTTSLKPPITPSVNAHTACATTGFRVGGIFICSSLGPSLHQQPSQGLQTDKATRRGSDGVAQRGDPRECRSPESGQHPDSRRVLCAIYGGRRLVVSV